MMQHLDVEKKDASETQRLVAHDEAEATKQAAEANAVALEASERVREANEQLNATLTKVKDLKKEHLVELKALL